MRKFWKSENTLIIMCGLPGSGKSTIAKKISEKTGIRIFCMDDIREKVFHDVYNQDNGWVVFKILLKHVRRELKKGNSVIIDCTSVTKRDRKRYLDEFKGLYKNSCCIFLNTSLDECKARNKKRDKTIPEERIDHFNDKLQTPSYDEGFTYLEVI